MQVSKSNKLANVCYDIRGPVLRHAKRLEEEGHRILKLNIGNPAPFGFEAPEEILQDVILNLPTAQGYSDSRGLFSARNFFINSGDLVLATESPVSSVSVVAGLVGSAFGLINAVTN